MSHHFATGVTAGDGGDATTLTTRSRLPIVIGGGDKGTTSTLPLSHTHARY